MCDYTFTYYKFLSPSAILLIFLQIFQIPSTRSISPVIWDKKEIYIGLQDEPGWLSELSRITI